MGEATTRTGKPMWAGEVQIVREPNGDFSFYLKGQVPGAWSFHVRKDGSMTPGNLQRLERLFENSA
jgi:hypothetical protein